MTVPSRGTVLIRRNGLMRDIGPGYHILIVSLQLNSIIASWYGLRMRIPRDTLDYKVVVRRVAPGSRPFQWEVHTADRSIPLQVSADRFKGMEAAFQEGRAWLADYLAKQAPPPKRSAPRQIAEDVAPPTSIPLGDEEDDTLTDDSDAFDCDVDPAGETSIGNAGPVYPSSIG